MNDMKTKISNLIIKSHQSFASIFLAFSMFGFLFPHHTNQAKPNHQVDLTTSGQSTDPEPADDGSQYEWFY